VAEPAEPRSSAWRSGQRMKTQIPLIANNCTIERSLYCAILKSLELLIPKLLVSFVNVGSSIELTSIIVLIER
jgi:hypothetical protein